MMLANVPVVFFGDKLTRRVPIKVVHAICAAIFAVLGLLALFNVGNLT
jgi:putative Ca2+/H+ antiporter (TMEM165/GDT1 family)